MEGASGPSAVDPGGGQGRQRRRRLGTGLVVACATAALALWAGLRHGRGPSDRVPNQEAYLVPASLNAAVDSGIQRMEPLSSPQPTPPISDIATTPQLIGGAGGLDTTTKNDTLASILGLASSTAASSSGSGEAPPPDSPPFQSVQGRISSGALGLRTCYPKNGTEVVAMASGDNPCTVLILTKSSQDGYAIRKTINITTPKIFIGNPIDPPVLNSTRIERLFDVREGGFLDIRAVQLIKGVGRRFDDGSLVFISGCTVRVWPGGYFRGTEVFFRELRQTLQAARNDINTPNLRRRIFGGHVLVMGGSFRCLGCMTFRLVPFGVLTANQIQIGRDILVVAGLATYVGGYAGNAPLFLSTINVGNNFCVLGGVAIWIGGGGLATAAAIGQFGAGQNLWVGGGVMIMVGYQDSSVFLNVQRAGFGQYAVGAGVYIMVGELENRAWGVGSVFNAGQAYSCGAGILQMHGGDSANTQISTIQAVAGGSMFLGSGDMVVVGFPFARFAVTQAQYGAGLVWFNGGGSSTFVYTPGLSVAVVRVQALKGIEFFMGYGMNTNILNTRRTFQVVNALMGGNEFFIGGGAAVFIRVRSIVRRKINWRTTRVAFYVAGTEVIGAVSRENIYVDKDGVFMLPSQNETGTARRALPALDSSSHNRSSLVLAQTELDTVSGVSIDAEAFKIKLQQVLLRGRDRATVGGERRLSAIGPLGGVSIVELAKVWRAAFDASSVQASPTPVRAHRERKAEIESVYVGGRDNQCFLCGVFPLPSALHLPPPSDGAAECVASDACVGETVPRTAKGALDTAEAAAPEPLLLPPHVKYSLPLMHRKLLALEAPPAAGADDQDAEDEPYPDLPTTNLLAYDMYIYCAPPQQQDGGDAAAKEGASYLDKGCGLSEAQVKGALKSLAREAMDSKGLDFPFQLTAANTQLHLPVVLPALEEEVAERLGRTPDVGLDGCSTHGSKFAVFLTTSESEGFDALHALFESWRQQPRHQGLIEAFAPASGVPRESICSFKLSKRATLRLPPINTAQGAKYYQRFYTGMLGGGQPQPQSELGGLINAIFASQGDEGSSSKGGERRNLLVADAFGDVSGFAFPSLLLLEEGRIAPVERAVAGRSYTVALSGFNLALAGLEVKLYEGMPPTVREEAALRVPKGTAAATDGQPVSVSFVAPEPSGARPRSRAYLQASYVGLPMPFVYSLSFDLVGSERA